MNSKQRTLRQGKVYFRPNSTKSFCSRYKSHIYFFDAFLISIECVHALHKSLTPIHLAEIKLRQK